MARLKRLTRDEHREAARLLCGADAGIKAGLSLVGPAIGAARLDAGLKAHRTLDVRVIMHLQDQWDDDFGPEGNPYRAAVDAEMAKWYADHGTVNPFAAA